MSINTITTNELANQRKITSDYLSRTEDLTFGNQSVTNSSHGLSYKKVRIIKDNCEINKLINQTDADYFDSLGSDF